MGFTVSIMLSTSSSVSGDDYQNPHPTFPSPTSSDWFLTSAFLIRLFIHALVIHVKKPLSYRCHMGAPWTIPVVCLHSLYVAALVVVTGAVHHIEFRFEELKDLWREILVSAVSIVAWLGRVCTFFDEVPDVYHVDLESEEEQCQLRFNAIETV